MISVLIALLLNLSGVFSSPVLLWSNGNFPSSSISLSNLSPLKLLSQSICQLPFERIQLRLFAVNDLTHSQLQRGPSSEHPLLRAAKESNAFRYYPEVSGDVYKTFSMIEQSNQYECSKIQFHLSSSSIYKSLDEALNAMEVSINSLGNNDNAIVIMALIPGPTPFRNEIRLRRAVESTDNILISDDSSCMFYAERLYLGSTNPHDPSSKNYTLDLDNSSCEPTENNSTNSTVTLKLVWLQEHSDADNVEMTFRIEMSGLYWTLERVFFNDSEYRYFAYGMHSLMETPPRFSYACTTATFVKYNPVKYGTYDFKSRFFIKNLQFQPYHANGSYFGPVNYCTSFFTSGIWMGITSSLLCLGILLFGVQRMMAIQPNSRYDDPKGKPLVIKAQE